MGCHWKRSHDRSKITHSLKKNLRSLKSKAKDAIWHCLR